MRYYGYSDKKSKYKSRRKLLWFNILIIVLIVAASVVFALVLGNYLKKRLDNADISTEPIEHVTAPAPADTTDSYEVSKNDRSGDAMSATEGFLDLVGCTSENDARAFVANLKNAGYTGVYFEAKSADGSLTYSSDAAGLFTGGKVDPALIRQDILAAAVTAARENGMRSGVGICISKIFNGDEHSEAEMTIVKYIIKELSDMGFNEVILSGAFCADSFSSEIANKLFDYVSSIRDMCPETDIGVVMDLAILENPELTPAIELAFQYTDFFALDFTDAAAFTDERLKSVFTSLSGSFNAYCIRSLTAGGSVAEIQAKYALFSSAGYTNISFIKPNNEIPEPTRGDDGSLIYKSKIYPYSLVPPPAPADSDEGDKTN